jgi:hypothetical protein
LIRRTKEGGVLNRQVTSMGEDHWNGGVQKSITLHQLWTIGI